MDNLPFAHSYYVIPGKLIAGEIPSSYNKKKSRIKLDGLINASVGVVINLMQVDEVNHYGDPFKDYTPYLNSKGIITQRFAIRDMSIPDPATMTEILNTIDQYINTGKMVFVHCWGGVGRTGTVIGCYLIRHGIADKTTVMDYIAKLRCELPDSARISPETGEQKEFVLSWMPEM